MVDITQKTNTLRIATAQAIVKVSKPDTIEAIQNKTVPKGDVFEMSKAAGLLGVKKTPELLPDCHPLPIEYTGIEYEIKELEIHIKMTVKTIYKTGVEVEAMHGVSIVALNMYDMLKPIDKGVEIHTIKLLSKKGGKSDRMKDYSALQAAVIVCSDTISQGKGEDKAGKAIVDKLSTVNISNVAYEVIADDFHTIQEKVNYFSNEKYDLIVFTGGTGVSVRDTTPDAVAPLLDKTLDGIMETARAYGQERMPFAMLSRGVAGVKNQSIILTLPGSTNGAKESLAAIFPHVLHLTSVLRNERHD